MGQGSRLTIRMSILGKYSFADGEAYINKNFLDLLKQRVIDLEAENAKLKQIIEENAKREAENINLKMELKKISPISQLKILSLKSK